MKPYKREETVKLERERERERERYEKGIRICENLKEKKEGEKSNK